MQPWWEQEPERYQYELRELDNSGYQYRINEVAQTGGHLVITVDYPYHTGTTPLTVLFPEQYPYFPFEIEAHELRLNRHQNIFNKQLCFMEDDAGIWEPNHDTLARVLTTQIPKIFTLDASNNSSYIEDNEIHAGEPVTSYYTYLESSSVIIDDWNIPENINTGLMTCCLSDKELFRGVIKDIRDKSNRIICRSNENIIDNSDKTIKGRWVRLPKKPTTENPRELIEIASKINSNVKNPMYQHGLYLTGFYFEDEVTWNNNAGNWLFLIFHKQRGQRNNKLYFDKPEYYHFVRTLHGSKSAMLSRAKQLETITNKKALIVGLGSLGSTAAMQLAKTGIGEIRLMDDDVVEPGNSLRWALGWQASGYNKADALQEEIKRQYPYIKTQAYTIKIGQYATRGRRENEIRENEIIEAALDDVDIILDATADFNVNFYLSSKAKELGIPYIWVTTTYGVWGGVVGRVVPGETDGCWSCYRRHVDDGTIEIPNQDIEESKVQPAGCSETTFSGTGFDSDQISLAAVRHVIATLSKNNTEGYPDFDWDVGIVNLRDSNGRPMAPKWSTHTLTRHSQCEHTEE
jgi:molybdopterin/thiamine biosynthesis adenylyltransferase